MTRATAEVYKLSQQITRRLSGEWRRHALPLKALTMAAYAPRPAPTVGEQTSACDAPNRHVYRKFGSRITARKIPRIVRQFQQAMPEKLSPGWPVGGESPVLDVNTWGDARLYDMRSNTR